MVLFASLAFVSCGSDEKEDTQQNSVVGVWKRTEYDWDGSTLITYGADGKYSLVGICESYDWSEYGSYTVKGSVITRVDATVPDDDPEKVVVYRILTLTVNTMILRYEGSYEGQKDGEIEEWTRVE